MLGKVFNNARSINEKYLSKFLDEKNAVQLQL